MSTRSELCSDPLVSDTGRVWPPWASHGPLVIETVATRSAISHRLTTNRSQSSLIRLATAALPGLRIEAETDQPLLPRSPSSGVRLLGPARGMFRTDLAQPLNTSLLAALTGLRAGEVMVIQWLVAPLGPSRHRPPAVEAIDREKRSELEVAAAGRVAASAKSVKRAGLSHFGTCISAKRVPEWLP